MSNNCFIFVLTRTFVFGKLVSERRSDNFMEKFFKKYGVILLLYLVIICGILLLNERCRLLNEQSVEVGIVQK